MKIFGIALFVIIAVAFGSEPSTAQTKAKIPADLEIRLQRTVCFGTCPDYTLTIKADRSIAFLGGNFTGTKGTATGRISKASLLKLIKAFDRIDLASFADDYSQGTQCESYITDVPSEIISLTRNGSSKTVNHYFGCRAKDPVQKRLTALSELGKLIDRLANSSRWIGKRN
jgi:hypothetical protein